MITSNVIHRVFHLKYGEGTGTCFAIDYDDKQYIITAKHVIDKLKDKDIVEIFYNGKWTQTEVDIIGHHKTADVSVFAINTVLGIHKLEPSSNGIAYGQDTFFLGFPYQLQDEKNSPINRNFPLPLVKKSILSCMAADEYGKYMLLDGINNPGFSGGPVVFKESNKNDFKIAAVISGYRFSNEPTYIENQQTAISTRANTGIIIAYSIENAIDLIKENPIGKELKPS